MHQYAIKFSLSVSSVGS